MKIFEGKSPSERNKLIAAMTLGALALLSLVYTFSGLVMSGKKTTVNVKVSPTPTATGSSTSGTTQTASVPKINDQEYINDYIITPVVYTPPGYAPEAGRNIFAFYEPPPPTPYVPTPIPVVQEKTPIPPTPTPPPPFTLAYVSPQSVFAGQKTFRLEVNGDKFTTDALIIWNGSQLPTNYVSPQKLTADISANLIAAEGTQSIEVRSPDGKYSVPVQLVVQAPPKPNYQYIGMISRSRGNNDMATLIEPNKPTATPFNVRLNDIIPGGRFRTISISKNEVVMEDTMLGFRHKLPLFRGTQQAGLGGQTTDGRGGFGDRNQPGRFPTENTVVQPYNPTLPSTQEIPGIPNNIPRYVPPQPQQQQNQKKDVDDDDEDGDN